MTLSGLHLTPRPAPRRVLEDASGRRLRRLRWVGRVIAVLFLLWLLVVILGGLGVGPASHLPLGHLLRPSTGPPAVHKEPRPRQPRPADLVPAIPAAAIAANPRLRSAPGKSALAPGHLPTRTTRGRSSSAPGHTSTVTHGRSGSAPGQTKTTATTTTVTTVPGKALGRGKKP
jgi:hypothetical protein